MQKSLGALAIAAAFLLAGSAAAHEASSKGVTVAHPWVRANPGGSTLTAAFLEVKASKESDGDKLLSVSTPAAGRAELHTHVKEGDVMKMRRVEAIAIKGGESHVLKPSGDHVMLLDLKAPLKEGDLVKLTLTFEKAGPIDIEATVEPPGAMGPHGMTHQPGADDEKSGGGHEGHDHH